MKSNDELSPEEVIRMPLSEFEHRFGFRPVDALEKKFFASNGKRPSQTVREALEAGVIGDLGLEAVNME